MSTVWILCTGSLNPDPLIYEKWYSEPAGIADHFTTLVLTLSHRMQRGKVKRKKCYQLCSTDTQCHSPLLANLNWISFIIV